MDIRIVNKENNMFGVGSRTLRTNGKAMCLFDSNSDKIETIDVYADEQIAENTKAEIIRTIKRNAKAGIENLVITL